jgi:hypothetical protein
MPTVSLTGQDTVFLGGRVFLDFADADNASLTFPNDISAVKTGKNGNSLYALNASGKQADLVLRLIRGSGDDLFLNYLLSVQLFDFPSMVLLNGQFVKRLGNGRGRISSDTYQCTGGIFSKQVEVKSNSEGDTEQSLSIYNLKFSNAERSIF